MTKCDLSSPNWYLILSETQSKPKVLEFINIRKKEKLKIFIFDRLKPASVSPIIFACQAMEFIALSSVYYQSTFSSLLCQVLLFLTCQICWPWLQQRRIQSCHPRWRRPQRNSRSWCWSLRWKAPHTAPQTHSGKSCAVSVASQEWTVRLEVLTLKREIDSCRWMCCCTLGRFEHIHMGALKLLAMACCTAKHGSCLAPQLSVAQSRHNSQNQTRYLVLRWSLKVS